MIYIKNYKILCLMLTLLSFTFAGSALSQQESQGASETAPGLFATGYQDSTMTSPVERVLESYETINVFVSGSSPRHWRI
jgi:hypothetical protein